MSYLPAHPIPSVGSLLGDSRRLTLHQVQSVRIDQSAGGRQAAAARGLVRGCHVVPHSHASSRLPDQRSLAEFEKMVLGAPLSAQLQEELKRTIAVRNMPSITTEASIRRVLDQVPGGIRNVALYDHISFIRRCPVSTCGLGSRVDVNSHLYTLCSLRIASATG